MTTAFPSVFCIMGTGQRDMLRDGREPFPEHADLKNGITGHHIFNLVGILVELQADVLYPVIFVGKLYPFPHAVYESCPQCFLVGGAQVQVSHVGAKVCLPLGMEGIRIDAGADIVQLHLGRIADVHAVDLDGSEQQHEGQDHVDGKDDEDGEEGHVPAFVPEYLLIHGSPPLLPVMFTDARPL